MENKVTILVNSCDNYEDAWEPFFKLLKIQWPGIEKKHKLVLNTETKVYDCSFLPVKTVCTGNCAWSLRLKKALESIDTELVLFMLEDFFLMSAVDEKRFENALKILETDKSIGAINFDPDYKKVRTAELIKRYYNKEFAYLQVMNAQCCLWRKSFLLNLINKSESAWEFEDKGNLRVKYYKERILFRDVYSSPVFDYHAYLTFGYGISRRAWLPKNKELFEKYGIEVDFDKLGWYQKPDIQKRIKRTKKQLMVLAFKHPAELAKIIITKIKNSIAFQKFSAFIFATKHFYR